MIGQAETLARVTFTDILPSGDGWVDEVVTLQNEFKTLIRVESSRFESLKADLMKWRAQVTCGEVDFDAAREDDFKGALRAVIQLEDFLIEKFDAYADKGLFLAKPRLIKVIQMHREAAKKLLDGWKSPEWDTADERTVEWDAEQTAYLRAKIEACR